MKKVILLCSLIVLCQFVKAQQGFGTSNPAPSAVIDMVSGTKGALLPRVALTSTAVAAPVNSPADALTVFNTATAGTAPNNVSPGYYYWSMDAAIPANSKWVKLLDSATPLSTTHTLTNPTNTITSIVNGVSVTAPAVNTNGLSLTGTNLTSTVNTVASAALDLKPAITAATTHALTNPTNTITSVVNGVSVSAPAVNTNGLSLTGTNLTSTVNTVASAALDLKPAITAATTNVLTNPVNTITSVVNGVSVTAPAVNTNGLSLAGTNLTSTVNTVASAALDLKPAITAATTNVLTNPVNTITSNVNGVSVTAPAVNTVSNTSAVNSLSTMVNGVTGTVVPIVNSNALSLTGTSLTSTVNGVASAALNLQPAITAGTTHTLASAVNTITSVVNGVSVTAPAVNSNTLTATNGNLVSTVNGVATTPAVPVLISASNGLTATNGDVKLGGLLTQATVITADATKTLALAGLQNGLPTDKIVSVDATSGVIKTLKSALPKFFYAPSVVIPTHTSAGVVLTGTQTLDVYALYAQQFGFTASAGQARSSATSYLPVLPANQLDYFITYFDTNVFNTVTISTAGIISYTVKSTAVPTEATFMNIVFKVQD